MSEPTLSCGASGVLFGVWGALAVFGIRYYGQLPSRYRRYFLGSVVPYALFSLYLGFVFPGTDNAGHLGGLCAGVVYAFLVKPTCTLSPVYRRNTFKIAAMVWISAWMLVGDPGAPLQYHPENSSAGLLVAMPPGWRSLSSENFSYAFGNNIEVSVGVEKRPQWMPLDAAVRDFLQHDLPPVQQLSTPQETIVSGIPARKFTAVLSNAYDLKYVEYYVMIKDNNRYVLNLTSPPLLLRMYRRIFASMLASVKFADAS
jgi:hypothetical protein